MNLRGRSRVSLLAAAFVCFFSSDGAVRAQVTQRPPQTRLPGAVERYSIEGRVVSEDGVTPVANVRLTLLDMRGAARGTQVTDDEGSFEFYDLPDGVYTVETAHALYGEQTERVELRVNSIRGMRIVLRKPPVEGAPVGASRPLPVWAAGIPEKAREQYDQGVKLLRAREHKKSIAPLEQAIAAYPQYAAAHSALGMAYLGLRKEKEATAAFEAALKVDAGLPEACIGMATLHNGARRFGEAVPLLLRAKAVLPQQWRIHYELGEAYLGLQDLSAAEQGLLEARRLHAEFARTHLLLINVLVLQEKYPAALAAMDEYLLLFPKDSFAEQVRAKRDSLQREIAQPPPPKL